MASLSPFPALRHRNVTLFTVSLYTLWLTIKTAEENTPLKLIFSLILFICWSMLLKRQIPSHVPAPAFCCPKPPEQIGWNITALCHKCLRLSNTSSGHIKVQTSHLKKKKTEKIWVFDLLIWFISSMNCRQYKKRVTQMYPTHYKNNRYMD